MNHKRKYIICNICNKKAIHYGLGMCSACLRLNKRRTRPSFYLGTCYSEISRRVKTYDPLRPNYYGRKKCTKDEFFNRFLNDKQFLKLYKNWQKHNFQRGYAPSIDRIDNNKDYIITNLQFIQHNENRAKEKRIKIKLIDKNNKIYKFDSCTDTANFLKIDTSTFCEIRKIKKEYKGYKIYEL